MAQQDKKIRVIWLVGGGTGGHIMPLLAVAEVLRMQRHVRLYYIGEGNSLEEKLAKQHGIRFCTITSGKLRRYFTLVALWQNLRDGLRLVWGIGQSYRLIRKTHPDLIFTKGGYVTLPVAIAAWLTKTPLIAHESDSVIGKTNRLIAYFARRILTAFPADVYPLAIASKVTMVGLPLRSDFTRTAARHHHSRIPMVLITGASQGALAINDAFAPIIPALLEKAAITHITGALSYERFRALREHLPSDLRERYAVLDFTPDIADYMREATVVVSRSGSTIFELATLRKPMMLIPLPSAAHNHQFKNAEIFVRHKAAVLLEQANLTPESLLTTLEQVLADRAMQQRLQEGTVRFDCHKSAQVVASLLLKEIGASL